LTPGWKNIVFNSYASVFRVSQGNKLGVVHVDGEDLTRKELENEAGWLPASRDCDRKFLMALLPLIWRQYSENQ
jgi:hypothetical protein